MSGMSYSPLRRGEVNIKANQRDSTVISGRRFATSGPTSSGLASRNIPASRAGYELG